MFKHFVSATLKTLRVQKGFLGFEGQKTAETCTLKTLSPFRVRVAGYDCGQRVIGLRWRREK
jgi:hypothetical protein